MTKQELIQELATKIDVSKAAAERFVNAFTETVSDAIAEGDSVQLIGFGTFTVRERNARTARNPKTGEPITIAAKAAPVFKAGKALKEAVNK